jgi:mannose-6-phosphate isomerase-like protein (cupin superfamily)
LVAPSKVAWCENPCKNTSARGILRHTIDASTTSDRGTATGPIIENPLHGERVRFLKTVPETDGELLQYESWLAPLGSVGVPHVHPVQESRFLLLSGRASFMVDGHSLELGPGETLTVGPRTPHYLWNAGDTEAHLIIEFRPGLLKQEYFETSFGLARDGRLNLNGIRNLLQYAVLTAAYRKESRPLNQARWVHAALICLAPLGRLLGYRAHYARYCTRPAD